MSPFGRRLRWTVGRLGAQHLPLSPSEATLQAHPAPAHGRTRCDGARHGSAGRCGAQR